MTDNLKFQDVLNLNSQFRGTLVNLLDRAIEQKIITQREREIMYFRHVDWNSLENCGKKFGVTRERIRQIEGKALHKLRESML